MMCARTISMACLAVAGLSFSLVACAGGKAPAPDEPRVTLEGARDFQNRVLQDLMDFIPASEIIGGMVDPVPEGPAMPCNWYEEAHASGESSGVFLPGRFAVIVESGIDLNAVLDAIYARYESRAGWQPRISDDEAHRTLELVSNDGYEFYLDHYPVDGGAVLFSISSFSPCFEAPHDYDPFGDY